jgi:SAM-dependent methyltransferase
MIYRVQRKQEFKEENLRNWRANSKFWMQGKMRHLTDVHDATAQILGGLLTRELSHSPVLLDIGCGEGWLLRLIREEHHDVSYIGLDFNKDFIDNLSAQHSGESNIRFVRHDIERNLPEFLIESADIVVNLFNFFEVPDITAAFHNAAAALRSGGVLLVLTIDPIIQLISISKSLEELRESLRQYEECPSEIAYDKPIDVGNGDPGRVYKGILYSAAVYVEKAKAAGLMLTDYRELIKTASRNPQIYQYLLFQK